MENISQSDNKPNSKFVTDMNVGRQDVESKAQYYSFGTSFRYTENLQEHPFYVKSKYKDIKEDLYEYFKRFYEKEDKLRWLQSKLNAVHPMHWAEEMLQKFLANDEIVNANALWMENNEHKQWRRQLISTEDNSNKYLKEFIRKLCITAVPINTHYQSAVTDIVSNMLQIGFADIVQLIEQQYDTQVLDKEDADIITISQIMDKDALLQRFVPLYFRKHLQQNKRDEQINLFSNMIKNFICDISAEIANVTLRVYGKILENNPQLKICSLAKQKLNIHSQFIIKHIKKQKIKPTLSTL
eukprot:29805_1